MPVALPSACHRTPCAALARVAVLAVAMLWSAPVVAQTITVGIDQARILRLDKPGAEFIVGNPSIADISVQNSRLLVITGKSFGSTSLIVLDADGREILNQVMSVTANPKQVVTLYRGAGRQSYECETQCEPVIMPGDTPEYLDAIAKAVRAKSALATSTAEESGNLGE